MSRKLLLSAFPDKLKQRRIACNLTQGELAEKTKISLKTISNWETKAPKDGSGPKASNILALCEVLDCDFEYLFCAQSDVEPTEEHIIIKRKTGLATASIDRLGKWCSLYQDENLPDSTRQVGKQFTDFYSSFICDFGITGAVSGCFGKILEVKQNGLTEAEACVFDNEKEAIDFYRFQLREELLRFIDRFLDEKAK